MLLKKIITERSKYQFRSRSFSPRTVDGIVCEGINESKFDPIPIIQDGDRWIVAGDGHSRLEACRRLADEGRLPASWWTDDGWDIPTRIVTQDAALELAWSANMGRDDFTPMEEARIFAARVEAGHSIEDIARTSHRTETHVRRSLQLLDLCREIQQVIGTPGGLNMMTAQILAVEFNRYGITKDQQRDLWNKALKHIGLTAELAKRFMKALGRRIQQANLTQDALLELPANAVAVLSDVKREFEAVQKARQAIIKLIEANEESVLDGFPELSAWLREHGRKALKQLDQRFRSDAAALGRSRQVA